MFNPEFVHGFWGGFCGGVISILIQGYFHRRKCGKLLKEVEDMKSKVQRSLEIDNSVLDIVRGKKR